METKFKKSLNNLLEKLPQYPKTTFSSHEEQEVQEVLVKEILKIAEQQTINEKVKSLDVYVFQGIKIGVVVSLGVWVFATTSLITSVLMGALFGAIMGLLTNMLFIESLQVRNLKRLCEDKRKHLCPISRVEVLKVLEETPKRSSNSILKGQLIPFEIPSNLS